MRMDNSYRDNPGIKPIVWSDIVIVGTISLFVLILMWDLFVLPDTIILHQISQD